MRCVTYAGQSVITTDDVAAALIILTAAVARDGEAEAVSIPIVLEDSGEIGDAELVIGLGNDVLSAPMTWTDEVPDFSEAAQRLREHRKYPHAFIPSEESEDSANMTGWDYDFDGYMDER